MLKTFYIKLKGRCLFLIFLSILAFVSCNDSKENSQPNGDSTSKNRNVFRYNQASGISSLDPAFAKDQANIWAVNQLFNGLVQMDDELNIRPCIAKSWDISEDGLTYTFKIRNDVYFHDNELFKGKKRSVTAGDVEYSLKRIINPEVASTGAWLFADRLDKEEPFKALNDSVFQMKLLKPFRPMLSILSMQYCSIVPEEVVKHYGKEFRKHPVGTGPFQFKTWRENEVLVMTKNPNYFEKRP